MLSGRRRAASIEDLLGGLGDGEQLAEIVRLGARLVLQRAIEEEVTAFLGRARYERTSGGSEGRRAVYGGADILPVRAGEGATAARTPRT